MNLKIFNFMYTEQIFVEKNYFNDDHHIGVYEVGQTLPKTSDI